MFTSKKYGKLNLIDALSEYWDNVRLAGVIVSALLNMKAKKDP